MQKFEEIYIEILYKIKTFISDGFIPRDMYGNIDWFKILLAVLSAVMIIGIFLAIIWTNITTRIKASGRCYIPRVGENPFILAKDRWSNPMYKVTYDLEKRNTKVTCECNPGEIVNNFNDIKVRDLKNLQDLNQTKTCMCDTQFRELDLLNRYYYGNQGIIRYVKTGDTTAFNPAYEI